MKNILLLIVLVMYKLGCYPPEEIIITPAHVHKDSVQIFVTENRPDPRVIVEFEVGLNGCESFHGTVFWWQDKTLIIQAEMSYPQGGEPFDCPDSYDIHKESVCVGAVKVGKYQVKVNGIIKDFQITD